MKKKIGNGLKPLEMLDLSKCQTVSDIVDGMSRCAFGARMLGEVATKLTDWCREREHPFIIFDGKRDTSLYRYLIKEMMGCGFHKIITSQEYNERYNDRRYYDYGERCDIHPALVVGMYSEKHADMLYARHNGTTVYINQFDLAKPGQVKDGYFPDAVFSDPRFIIPLLCFTIRERLTGKKGSVAELIAVLRQEQFGGLADQVVHGADTMLAMMQDPKCFRFLTLSGAMTIAQMSLVICEMIERGIAQSITATGALMAHGLMPGLGLKHYKYNPADNDLKLAKAGLNRVTDTLEPETNFDHLDEVMNKVLNQISGEKPINPSELHKGIGRYLKKTYPQQRAIMKSAFEHKVPVFVPAFVDSELGNDVFVSNIERRIVGKSPIVMDMEIDSMKLMDIMAEAEHPAIISIGGGVPRNNVQNVAPLMEIYNNRLGSLFKKHPEPKRPVKKFRYGCRICPDKPHIGHLSGCTYQENMSWRKMDPNGMFAEIQADATIVWPFLIKYIMDWQDRKER
ncbi:MAG: Deoxyhypusine synthase [Candidatus Wolfebacteria bacterium GW2011_GWA2_42_10]|uniref:Deoxyhypusine synthase n=1 Tax=Candidatus Wolfebacteria bacterium GW2011_GWA2_42_10 TaxID=1619004 RepID=A0A0G0ZTQ1_9BACT|nr:MAG: Deoxyhypusine synthase [Candidatus Wolfebacteria bacterium GW2011_GWA2_42_10]